MDFLRLVQQTARFHRDQPAKSEPVKATVVHPATKKPKKRAKKNKKKSNSSGPKLYGDVKLFKDNDDESEVDEMVEILKQEQESARKQRQLKIEHANAFRRRHRIHVRGGDVCDPVESFQQLQEKFEVPSYIVENMASCGWEEPTAIQMQAIPTLLGGRELLAVAPTGSGKTAAFVCPILAKLKEPRADGIRALVLSPTRELAQQIYRQFLSLSSGRAFRVFLLSRSNADSIDDCQKRDILVSTPSRIVDLIKKGKIDLSHVQTLIFDEGDNLFESGLIEHVDAVLAACTNPGIQRALFSATMPYGVEQLACTVLKDPIRIVIGQHDAATESIDQKLLFTGSEQGKLTALRNMLREGLKPPALIFVQSKSRARQLFSELKLENYRIDFIDSDQTQIRRETAVANFRTGKTWALICTDMLSRGIDFKGVSCVINYDFPQSTVSYIHRIGRTGRAGLSGEAITFFNEEDSVLLRSIASVMRRSGCEVPDWMLALHKPNKSKVKELKTRPPKRKRIGTGPDEPKQQGRRHKQKTQQ